MKITPLQKKIMKTYTVVWLVSLVVILAFYFAVVSPAQSELNSVNAELAAAQTKLNTALETKSPSTRQKFIDKLEKLHGQLSEFVVGSDNWINIMPYISDVSEENKVKMFASQDVSEGEFSQIPQCEKLGAKSIEVSFNADFPRFASFVSSLERGTPVIFIEDFLISRPSSSNELPSVDMRLNVLINTSGSLTMASAEQQMREKL